MITIEFRGGPADGKGLKTDNIEELPLYYRVAVPREKTSWKAEDPIFPEQPFEDIHIYERVHERLGRAVAMEYRYVGREK